MAAYYADYNQNYAQLNPTPTYKRNQPSNFESLQSSQKYIDYRNNNTDGYYEKYQQSSTVNYDRARQATQGFFEKNHITVVFFSDENMKRIQKKIKEEVIRRTKGQYQLDEDQDESDLTIVMRAVYLDKCKNLPGETVRQVKLLNQQTVDYIVPDLISNVKQYFGYIKDINQPLQPMMRPMNVSSSGRRLLPSVTTLYR
jgi:hypothetical protein